MTLSWITVVWSLLGGAYLTVGVMQIVLWFKDTRQPSRLAFGVLSLAWAGFALCELLMMHARTPAEYGLLMRWVQVPALFVFLAIVMFVRTYLGAGRLWLAYAALGLRLLAAILAFYLDPNLNYQEIVRLERVEVFGAEAASVAVGIPSPWRRIGELSSLFLLFFLVDAISSCWKRGDREIRRRTVLVGGSLVFMLLFAALHSLSIHAGLVSSVYLMSLPFLVVLAAVGFAMRTEVVLSAELAGRLRKTVSELVVSEQRMEQAVIAAKLVLWDWDIARDEFGASAQARELLCIAPAEKFDFERFLNALHHEDRDAARAAAARAVETGEAFSIEFRVPLADGRVRWIQSRGGVHRDDNGMHARILGVSFDVTERKERDAALQDIEVRLASAMELAALGSYELSADGAAVEVSIDERMGAILGVPHDQPHRFRDFWLERLHPDDRARVLASSQAMLQRQIDFVSLDYRYLHPQRGLRWIHHLSRALKPHPGDAHLRLIGVVQDITERKQSEHEIEQQRTELAHLSRVTMLSELSGSIAHEMNQPLAAILSNAQAALRFMQAETPDLEEVCEILRDIVSDDRRAGEVIQGLRLLLKRGELRREPFDMNQVVRDVIRLVHSSVVNANVSVTTALRPDLPSIIGDRVQFQQVVLNLVINGCDAMTNIAVVADRKLRISTELVEGKRIRVCVADAGVGIASEHLQRVFEAFFSTKVDGLGLGLSVCRQIIAAHDGRLWFANNAGPGASFYIDVAAESSGAA